MRHPRQVARPLRIVVHGFNERAYSMLSLLLSGPDWTDCTLVGQGHADLGIVDLDTPSPDRTWREFRNRHPELPSIVLSLREQRRDNARHLRKPIDTSSLRQAIDAVRQEVDSPPPPPRARFGGAPTAPAADAATARIDGPPAVTRTPRRAPPAAPAFTPFAKRTVETAPHTTTRDASAVLDLEVEERNCGTTADVDLADVDAVARITYDPARHFQAVLEQAIAVTRESGAAHEIVGLPGPLRVVPGRRLTVATTLKDTVLRSLCVMTLQPGTMGVVPAVTPPAAGDAKPVSADSLLWQVALWTARGRLRRGIAPETRVRLARWPDFTRVAETPHAMRVAAVLVGAPHSAAELCADLRIPQRYVFSFLTAAATAMQLDLVARAEAARPAPAAPAVARATPPRGLLSRILGRLVGGAAR